MPNRAGQRKLDAFNEPDHVIERAAELFDVLSAPQHLNTLYKAGILGKRRDGEPIYYRIIDGPVDAYGPACSTWKRQRSAH